MSVLTVDDVIAYTGGRLADDDETQRKLDAALAACRAYCGWHVTPLIQDDEMTVDGPGGFVLALPTRQLVTLSTLTEDGDSIDVDTELTYSTPLGLVRKNSGGYWSDGYAAITVKMDHGFDVCPDFDVAVLEWVDRASLAVGAAVGNTGVMVAKKVDDVTYQWASSGGDLLNKSLLDAYRLPILA